MLLLPTIATICLGLAIPLGYLALAPRGARGHRGVTRNLTRGLDTPRGRQGASPRASATEGIHHLVERLTPAGVRARLERLHAMAGRPAAWPPRRAMAAKLVIAGVTGWLALTQLSAGITGGRLLLLFVGVPLGYFVPELILHSRGKERQAVIQNELADTLDQMTIAVEAGLAFGSAMAKAAKNGKGPLAEEFTRTLQDIQVGVSRRDAFRALADRTTVTDLRRFVAALLQAETYGVAVAEVLRTQSAEMRLKRRQRAEEKAMQIPVKVIFPLILCILPTLFIVLLGPAAINIMRSFGGAGA